MGLHVLVMGLSYFVLLKLTELYDIPVTFMAAD